MTTFEEGWRAFWHGYELDDCPYCPGEFAREWVNGWWSAYDDDWDDWYGIWADYDY